ncbi:hypothetical protein WME73_04295 [Sorangium sp. So ce302]
MSSYLLEPGDGRLGVVSVPVVAGFLLLQRYLFQGLTAGAVKT